MRKRVLELHGMGPLRELQSSMRYMWNKQKQDRNHGYKINGEEYKMEVSM
jgi:hypothetical protein